MTSDSPVFVDSSHIIALCIADDQWRDAALEAAGALDRRRLVTSVGVFQEVLAHVSRSRSDARSETVRVLREMQADPWVTVVEHNLKLVGDAMDLYDGEFLHTRLSLQDCIAIQIMRDFGITEILSTDQEFSVAGVTPLLRRFT